MTGALRGLAVLGFGVFTGGTLMLFPATLVGFQHFPEDPELAGRLASLQFDGYAVVAWSALAVGVVATLTLKLRRADRVLLPLVAGAVAVACVASWLLVMRPVIDRSGQERRAAATEAARADADARFKLWHGVSMVAALAGLLAGAVATMGASRARD